MILCTTHLPQQSVCHYPPWYRALSFSFLGQTLLISLFWKVLLPGFVAPDHPERRKVELLVSTSTFLLCDWPNLESRASNLPKMIRPCPWYRSTSQRSNFYGVVISSTITLRHLIQESRQTRKSRFACSLHLKGAAPGMGLEHLSFPINKKDKEQSK